MRTPRLDSNHPRTMAASRKRFNFFDKTVVKPKASADAELLSGFKITCGTGGRGGLILGDADGFLTVADCNFESMFFQRNLTFVNRIQ